MLKSLNFDEIEKKKSRKIPKKIYFRGEVTGESVSNYNPLEITAKLLDFAVGAAKKEE